MARAITNVEFLGTLEQEKELLQFIEEHKTQKGALMPVLQKAQDIYGYLPIEIQEIIASELKISVAEVYGVVTFYSQFSVNPKGKYNVSVCLGTACYVKGSGEILEKLKAILKISEGEITSDGKFSMEACRCVGACGLAPVMTINDEVYGRLKEDDIQDIISKYE